MSDLQRNTLIRIFGVCPRPSTAVINMISAEMKLPKECIVDFFVGQRRKSFHQETTAQHMSSQTGI